MTWVVGPGFETGPQPHLHPSTGAEHIVHITPTQLHREPPHRNSGRMMVLHILLLCLMAQWGESSTLKSGFGTNFRHHGQIHPALDKQFIALDLTLPTYDNKYDPSMYDVQCKGRNGTTDHGICTDFQWLINRHALSIKHRESDIQSRIRKILYTLPTGKNHQDRAKRGLGMLIFGIVSGLASAVNSVIMRKQLNAMSKTVQILEDRQFVLEDNYINLSDDVIAIAQLTSDKFQEVARNFNHTNKAIAALSKEIRVRILPQVESMYKDIQILQQTVRILAKRTTRTQYHISMTAEYYNNMIWYLSNYEAGVIDLMQGKLPPSLIDPSELSNILDKASASLDITHPDYELVFPLIAHYYRKKDIVYTLESGHLIVLIPLLLKRKNQQPMDLYAIDTCYVPFDIGNKSGQSTSRHTKISIKPEYIAVRNSNFAEITNTQLDACEEYNGLFLCDRYILQVHQSSLTCASAIFWDQKADTIEKLCHFSYFHAITPPPCILESATHVLLTNLDNDWQFRCKDENVPIRLAGSNFAVVPRTAFCGCALIGRTYFIPERIEDCPNKTEVIRLKYPLNAAVLSVYGYDLKEGKYLNNLSDIYTVPQNLDLPSLSLQQHLHGDDILADGEFKQELNLKRVIQAMKDRKPRFLDREDKQLASGKIENWFLNIDNIAIGTTFILSILGSLAAILGVYNCIKTYKVMSIFGFLMAKPRTVQAASGESESELLEFVIKERIYQILIVICLYLVYKLAKLAHNKLALVKIFAPNGVVTYAAKDCHVMLEIGNATKGIVRLYVCSLATCISEINMIGEPILKGLGLTMAKIKLFGILNIIWPEEDFCLTCDGIAITLPTLVYISLPAYFKTKSIISGEHYSRICILYDGFMYLMKQTREKGTPGISEMKERSEIEEIDNFEEAIVVQNILLKQVPTPYHTLVFGCKASGPTDREPSLSEDG